MPTMMKQYVYKDRSISHLHDARGKDPSRWIPIFPVLIIVCNLDNYAYL